ncbi:unnamed protein product [Vitrella brassicaformis CCMP3155]|uniref:SET domain-containing protein n=1 Tax=Vitrella brassicaformis (strain CCMP3155) TaxID=1169540 RepID=A0A0G4GBT7_VITBC|nr:unnamed protein product [Vitrella brassicaformis CCMP3155]|eukprot:CEM26558.1 unnamed protein product [Vitrella brassicaformis CCMP3155]
MGLFACKAFRRGEVLCEYSGTVLTLRQLLQQRDRTYVMGGFGLNAHIDAGPHPEVLARYINDNFDKSKINVRFNKLKTLKRAEVIALRAIEPGEELYASYGQVYWRGYEARQQATAGTAK